MWYHLLYHFFAPDWWYGHGFGCNAFFSWEIISCLNLFCFYKWGSVLVLWHKMFHPALKNFHLVVFLIFVIFAFPGEKGIGPKTGKPLHYKGSFFHRIIQGSMAQVCCSFLSTFRIFLFLHRLALNLLLRLVSCWAWLRSGLLVVSYPCLCCRIQGWWSRLLFLWYSFKVVLTKLSILKIYYASPCPTQFWI